MEMKPMRNVGAVRPPASERIDLSSPEEAFLTFKHAIIAKDVQAFRAAIHPDCHDPLLHAAKQSDETARQLLEAATEDARTLEIGAGYTAGREGGLELRTDGMPIGTIDFRWEKDRWLIIGLQSDVPLFKGKLTFR